MTDTLTRPKSQDISNEEFRVYTYANGATLTIHSPEELYVLPNGSHRIVDESGLTHRPTPGWLGISWKPRPGTPAFSF